MLRPLSIILLLPRELILNLQPKSPPPALTRHIHRTMEGGVGEFLLLFLCAHHFSYPWFLILISDPCLKSDHCFTPTFPLPHSHCYHTALMLMSPMLKSAIWLIVVLFYCFTLPQMFQFMCYSPNPTNSSLSSL